MKQKIKKHLIIHFYTRSDNPYDFHIVFRLMGTSERVTSKYEFKGDPKN